MGIFIFIFAVIILNPGEISVQVDDKPKIIYNRETKKWTVPIYENTKHVIQCIERGRVKCLKGE